MANPNDEIQSKIIAREIKLARVEEELARKVQGTLLGLKKKVEKELTFFYPKDDGSFDIKAQQLTEFTKEIDSLIDDSYKIVKDDVFEHVNGVASSQASFIQKTVNDAFKAPLINKTLGDQTLKNYANGVFIEGTKVGDWINAGKGSNVQSDAKKNKTRIEGIVRNGLLQGDPLKKVVDDVAKISDLTRQHAEAIARTASQTAANQVKLDVYKLNDDVINGVQWVSTLDKRTTEICIDLDAKIWVYDENGFLKPSGHGKVFPGPIAHWRCRSTQIPVTKSFGDLGKAPRSRLAGMPQGTRASMGGQVTETMNARQWVEKQSEATQIKMLGKKKTELLRAGKLDDRSFTNFKNEPLTLKELE
jgi:SPP1 gp7 family putative phage head morphogenesis protein